MSLNNPGQIVLSDVGPRVLTLDGFNGDTNTLAAALGENGGATSLAKLGFGTWILTGSNTYSGGTTISIGSLQVGNGGSSGALGSGNVVLNNYISSLVFNRSGALTVGTITGYGSVTNNGSGTVILPGDNTYFNGTTINAGALQIGSGGAAGSLPLYGNVTDNATLIFNSTGSHNLSGVISGTGQLIKRGSGLLKLLGNNTYIGITTIDSGAVLQVGELGLGATMASPAIIDNGTFILAAVNATNSANISGTGLLVKRISNVQNQGPVTLTGTNTYAGGTFIEGGTLVIGDGAMPGAGSIVGNVVLNPDNDFSHTCGIDFNRPDDLTFGGNITGVGQLMKDGTGTLTLTGTLFYFYFTGPTTINAGTLQIGNGGTSGSLFGNVTDNGTIAFNHADSVNFGGVISGSGSLVQQGTGTLILPNTGSLTIDSGGTLAPGGVGSVGTFNAAGGLTISGRVFATLNKALSPSNSVVSVTGVINNSGGTLKLVNVGPNLLAGDKFTIISGPVVGGASMTIVSPGFTVANNLALDGSVTVLSVGVLPPARITPTISGGRFILSWPAASKGLDLQMQVDPLTAGLGANWVTIPETDSVNSYTNALNNGSVTVFYRLGP